MKAASAVSGAGAAPPLYTAKFNEPYTHGSAFDNTYRRLYNILNAETAAKLNKFGFAVVDNALGATEAHALRQEIVWLYHQQIMGSNNTAYVERSADGRSSGISQLISKPNVYEAEILPPLHAVVPRLGALCERAIPILDRHAAHVLPQLNICQSPIRNAAAAGTASGAAATETVSACAGCADIELKQHSIPHAHSHATDAGATTATATAPPTAAPPPTAAGVHHLSPIPDPLFSCSTSLTSVKVQYNDGNGGCFPFHYDSPGGRRDTRRLTVLIYLNPDWTESDGGCIRFQPWLGGAVDVPPLFDRVVMFYSAHMLHRVMPYFGTDPATDTDAAAAATAEATPKKPRICLTIWVHGHGIDEGDDQTYDTARTNAPTATIPAAAPTASATAPPTATAAGAGAGAGASDADAAASYWMDLLQKRSVQRLLSKAVYYDVWSYSIRQAHAGSGADVLQSSLDRDVSLITQPNTGIASVVKLLTDYVDKSNATRARNLDDTFNAPQRVTLKPEIATESKPAASGSSGGSASDSKSKPKPTPQPAAAAKTAPAAAGTSIVSAPEDVKRSPLPPPPTRNPAITAIATPPPPLVSTAPPVPSTTATATKPSAAAKPVVEEEAKWSFVPDNSSASSLWEHLL